MLRSLNYLILIFLPIIIISCSEREIDSKQLQQRNELYYAVNEEEPYSGKVITSSEQGYGKEDIISQVRTFKDGKLDGLFTKFSSDGKKLEEANYEDGKLHGLYIKWNKNGQKKQKGTYQDGKKQGQWVFWYSNGQKKQEGTYQDGKKSGQWIYWTEEGFILEKGKLTFTDSTGKEITKIDIEIADSDYERQLGLMNRESMDENLGMLFIFPVERQQSFWTRMNLFPLDIIFVNSKKEIITIHKNATPGSEQSYPSSKPAIYVVEVVAGLTDMYNIKEGDKIFWTEPKIKR